MPALEATTVLALITLLAPVAIVLGLEARRRCIRKRRVRPPLGTRANNRHRNESPREAWDRNHEPEHPVDGPRKGTKTQEGGTPDQENENARSRRASLGLTAFRELDMLEFPGYYVAHLDYFATGEGHCQGLRISYYRNAEELRSALLEQWGEYLAARCELFPGTRPLDDSLSLLPLRLHERLLNPTGDGRLAPRLTLEVTIHENNG